MSEVVQRGLAEDLALPVERYLDLPRRRRRSRRKKRGLFRGLVLRLVGAHPRPVLLKRLRPLGFSKSSKAMVLTRGRRRQQAQQEEEERAAQRARLERLDWQGQVFGQAPRHHLGHFLDRYDMAALEPMSRGMQENARRIIRARNEELPMGKRMTNLEGPFRVWVALKKLMKREGRQPEDMIATGGCKGGVVTTVMSLDLVTMRYTILAPMITARKWHATAVLDGKLFVMGGFNGGCLSSVECLDLETGQRSEMAPMIPARRNPAAAVLGGKIFVAGGSPSNTVGTLVESFDAATNQWTAVTPMNTRRCYHGLVSAQGKLFAIGGFNGHDGRLSSVECFDPSTRVWSNIAALSTARYDLAVAVLGDKLYAIGGLDSEYQRLSSVECLDLSVPNSQWTTVAPMTTPRYGMGAVGTGGKIYIAGGYGSSSIECFDPSDGPAGRWTVVSETSHFQKGSIIAMG